MKDDDDILPAFRSRPFNVTATAMKAFRIPHEMGRVPAGWLVIDSSKAVNVWRSGDMDKRILELTADKDVDMTLVLL